MHKINGVNGKIFDLSDVTKSQAPRAHKHATFKSCPRWHTDGAHHDCGYVDAINRLIPEASRMADRRLADYVEEFGVATEKEMKDVWSRLFIEEMQVDAEANGLRRGVKHV